MPDLKLIEDTLNHPDNAHFTRRPLSEGMEEHLGKYYRILDKGFVSVVDYMGTEDCIGQAARVSYGKGTKTTRDNAGLINYLIANHHNTPLEMLEIKIHVKLPVFVARQWIRHRTACLAGDTKLDFSDEESGTTRRIAIVDFYDIWKCERIAEEQLNRKPDPSSITKKNLKNINEDTLETRHTKVTDIWESGVKKVYEVILSSGQKIKMTKDHRCFTNQGWYTLKEIWNFDYDTQNFQMCCLDSQLRFVDIASVTYVGEEMTYDLSVEDPYHNFVANGIVVHNSVNEYSARYSILDREFYIPEEKHLAAQSKTNNQGRGSILEGKEAQRVLDILKEDSDRSYDHYEEMISQEGQNGLARELARMNLPTNIYTQWYWKTNLHNLLHFLRLRADGHAQFEIRVYAEALLEIVKDWVPTVHSAFVKNILETETFTLQQLQVLEYSRKFSEDRNRQDVVNESQLRKSEKQQLINLIGQGLV